MTALALVPGGGDEPTDLSGLSLPELAEVANREAALADAAVDEVKGKLSDGLMHMIRAGEALIEARKQLPTGAWHAWLGVNLPSKNQTYWTLSVRYATYKVQLFNHPQRLTCDTAQAALLGLPPANKPGWKTARVESEPWLLDEARRLRAEGTSWAGIGRELGVSRQTVQNWLDPEYKQRHYEAHLRSKRNRRAAKSALGREQRAQEATARGDHHGKSYEHHRKSAQALDHAIADARGAEREALEDCRRDLIAFEGHFAQALKHGRQA